MVRERWRGGRRGFGRRRRSLSGERIRECRRSRWRWRRRWWCSLSKRILERGLGWRRRGCFLLDDRFGRCGGGGCLLGDRLCWLRCLHILSCFGATEAEQSLLRLRWRWWWWLATKLRDDCLSPSSSGRYAANGVCRCQRERVSHGDERDGCNEESHHRRRRDLAGTEVHSFNLPVKITLVGVGCEDLCVPCVSRLPPVFLNVVA